METITNGGMIGMKLKYENKIWEIVAGPSYDQAHAIFFVAGFCWPDKEIKTFPLQDCVWVD
jgi:hypothetical protein